MITGEKVGTFIVKFSETEDGSVVGKIEGDYTPVHVRKKSLKANSGEIWLCHLDIDEDLTGVSYVARLLEKLGEEKPAVSKRPAEAISEDEFVINEPCKTVERKESEEEEYRILEDPERECMGSSLGSPSKVCGLGMYSPMDNECEEEDDEVGFVRYEGNNTLSSNLLVFDSYMAFRSPDNQVLQLIPCWEGGFGCRGGSIRIGVLEEMVGGRIGCQLSYRHDDGILTVFLDGE